MNHLILSLVLLCLLLFLIYRDRRNWKFGIVSVRKLKRVEVLDRLIKFPQLWNAIGWLGVGVCVFLLVHGMTSLLSLAGRILGGMSVGPVGGIVLPHPFAEFRIGHGYVAIPLWFFLLLIPLVLIPHEFLHALMLRLHGIKIKSAGLFALLCLPIGAFVEPEKRQFERASLASKLKVVCAGSFANCFMFLLLLALSNAWVTPVWVEGLLVQNVSEGSPAWRAGISQGMLVKALNNKNFSLPIEQFRLDLDFKPGEEVVIETHNKTFKLVAEPNPQNQTKGYLGMWLQPKLNVDPFYACVMWLAFFQIAIATLNALPIYPLDGGQALKALAQARWKRWQVIVFPVSIGCVALLFLVIVGPLLRQLLF